MNFGFTDEQELLRNEVRKFLDESCPLETVRKITEDASGPGFSRDHWQHIADLGWLGLTVPELHGGAGLGFVDLVVVLEETGRSLFPSPLVSNTLAAYAIRRFGSQKQQSRWLPRLVDVTPTLLDLLRIRPEGALVSDGRSLFAAASDWNAAAETLYPYYQLRGARLRAFYEAHGFAVASAPYDEDGIPHIEMLRA